MTASRREAITRATRDLSEAVARIQTEGGDSEQVSLEVVKKITRRRAAETKLAGPGKMIARSTPGKTAPPLSDEIAERLRQQTKARVKESRQLLDAAKRKLKRTKG